MKINTFGQGTALISGRHINHAIICKTIWLAKAIVSDTLWHLIDEWFVLIFKKTSSLLANYSPLKFPNKTWNQSRVVLWWCFWGVIPATSTHSTKYSWRRNHNYLSLYCHYGQLTYENFTCRGDQINALNASIYLSDMEDVKH